MFTLLRHFRAFDLLAAEGIPLLLSLFIAEIFYKFHSFLLETSAFFVTWVVIGFLFNTLFKRSLTPLPIPSDK